MPRIPATCPACDHTYVRRGTKQVAGGLCPACGRIARQQRLRADRAAAGLCVECGHEAPQSGRASCGTCLRARVARGFRRPAKV